MFCVLYTQARRSIVATFSMFRVGLRKFDVPCSAAGSILRVLIPLLS